MTSDEEIEQSIADFEDLIFEGLKAAINQTRDEFDLTALAEAITNEDNQAIAKALDVAANQMKMNAADRLKKPFAEFFESVGIMAATELGQPDFTMDRASLVVRDILLYQVTDSLPEFNRLS